ncbi:MAG TPA: histidine kinase dimerization/phospho-acceptor domain-containing protein, partial [Burkholderiales bacterium]|nr:histidine kinase dimerization/phospho-acceptor domain-containing protein [Burkholderiales bacterium]
MMHSAVEESAPWLVHSAAPAALRVDSFWRSLFLFNIYRFTVAVILLIVVTTWGNRLQFGSRDLVLFVFTSSAYAVFSLGCFALMRLRSRFDLQLTAQVVADIVFIVLLTYASDGISSGLGLLLLTVLAGAGLISRGRLALFHAALASIGVLLEHTYEVLKFDASFAQYAQAGLLSGAYFTTAWVAHALAKYTLASEQLAAQREIDLQNLAQVNQYVIQDMKDGVLVVDSSGVIRQFNARAERLLGPLRGRRNMLLAEYAPALQQCFAQWRDDEGGLDMNSQVSFARTLTARFVPVGRRRSAGALIFLEDLTRIQQEARQLKLAALGRLTANLAHEIRNPLGAISHATELLQEEPAADDTSRRLLTIIHDNTQRLDQMVHDVLWLNRGDRVQREAFDLADFLTAFVEQFCEIEKISPSVFKVDLRARPKVLFDRSHLDQVMWNLARNALRHCRRQEGSIQMVVSVERAGTTVRLDIVDDG